MKPPGLTTLGASILLFMVKIIIEPNNLLYHCLHFCLAAGSERNNFNYSPKTQG